MKKFFIGLQALLLISFLSCNKDDDNAPQPIQITLNSSNVSAYNTKVKDTVFLGQSALRVSFTDDYELNVGTQANAYAEIPVSFHNGIIEFDIALELNQYANEFTRGFGGVLFRKQNIDMYECIYLRGTNGSLNNPPPTDPRLTRAIQYISAPQYDFQVLRDNYPGVYEKGAKITINRWHHLKIEVNNKKAVVYIDGDSNPTLTIDNMFGENKEGKVGLFVDQGTNAYYKNMTILKL
jgi:hypothetical protein